MAAPARYRAASLVHTETYYDYYLEKRLREAAEEDKLDHLEHLISQAYSDNEELDDGQDKQSVRRSISRLENSLLCYVVAVGTDQLKSYDLVDKEDNSQRIANWIAMLDNRKRQDESFKLHHLLKRMGYCRNIIRLSESDSEAAQLLLNLDGIFDPSGGRGGFVESTAEEKTAASGSPGTAEHWALQQYIPIEEIQGKLGVVSDTLTRYFKESDAEVVEITNKNKWMHEDDFHDFMRSYKEKL